MISLLKQISTIAIATHVVPEGCSRNGISRLQVLWPGYILSPQQQSLSCSPSAEKTEFCETGTSHTVHGGAEKTITAIKFNLKNFVYSFLCCLSISFKLIPVLAAIHFPRHAVTEVSMSLLATITD